MAVKKPRNNGQWTEARYSSFIKSALRAASSRWGPKQTCKKSANVGYGKYKCELCGTIGPASLPPLEGRKKRRKNIVADHIDPVIDPHVGFVDWNEFIRRMFVEVEGYQALCLKCHDQKTADERDIATARRREEKFEWT